MCVRKVNYERPRDDFRRVPLQVAACGSRSNLATTKIEHLSVCRGHEDMLVWAPPKVFTWEVPRIVDEHRERIAASHYPEAMLVDALG